MHVFAKKGENNAEFSVCACVLTVLVFVFIKINPFSFDRANQNVLCPVLRVQQVYVTLTTSLCFIIRRVVGQTDKEARGPF